MTMPRHIAVLDIGKTNAKLALVDGARLAEIAVVTRPNTVLTSAPYPHFDLDGHWAFFLEHLKAFHASHGIDAISITTHGAAGVLLTAQGELATPMLDYEHTGPDETAAAYDAIRPDFARTGSPRLKMGAEPWRATALVVRARPDPQGAHSVYSDLSAILGLADDGGNGLRYQLARVPYRFVGADGGAVFRAG